MKKVFLITGGGNHPQIFTTARKAIESVQFGLCDTTTHTFNEDTGAVTTKKGRVINMENKTESDVKLLISKFSKGWTLDIDDIRIEKMQVQ